MDTLPQNLIVKKFGGTSVGSIERIEHVADRLVQDHKLGQKFVVVVSAMAGETNRLVSLAQDILPGHRGPAYDMLLASGEQVAVALLSIALEKRGYKARPFLGFQIGIQTDSLYSRARITNIHTASLLKSLDAHEIPVIAGFQGIDESQQITTLGRGGSDTTAVAIAAALGGVDCEIFTDVEGVFTADPRLVPEAQKIPSLTYDEMMEMAALGSKVLHFRCVEIGAKYNVRIHVRSTFSQKEGTWIQQENKTMEAPVVSAITHDAKIVVLSAEPVPTGVAFLADLFQKLADKDIVIDIISQSQGVVGQRIAFSLPDEDFKNGQKILSEVCTSEAKVQAVQDAAKVSIVGVGMLSHPGVAARFFKVFKNTKIDLHMVTTSDIKMSGVIPRSRIEEAVRALHTEFGLEK